MWRGHVDPRDGAVVYQALGVLVGELGTGADHAAAEPLGQDLGLNNEYYNRVVKYGFLEKA